MEIGNYLLIYHFHMISDNILQIHFMRREATGEISVPTQTNRINHPGGLTVKNFNHTTKSGISSNSSTHLVEQILMHVSTNTLYARKQGTSAIQGTTKSSNPK